ncbi:MAG: hypothetical protein JNN15_00320 [Blastocatellia bacterium]|nr:hypothetical protein [Blastocatellia bacterium]
MKIEIPDIELTDAKNAMELAKKLFTKYNVSQQDQDLLYNAILTMGIAAISATQKSRDLEI